MRGQPRLGIYGSLAHIFRWPTSRARSSGRSAPAVGLQDGHGHPAASAQPRASFCRNHRACDPGLSRLFNGWRIWRGAGGDARSCCSPSTWERAASPGFDFAGGQRDALDEGGVGAGLAEHLGQRRLSRTNSRRRGPRRALLRASSAMPGSLWKDTVVALLRMTRNSSTSTSRRGLSASSTVHRPDVRLLLEGHPGRACWWREGRPRLGALGARRDSVAEHALGVMKLRALIEVEGSSALRNCATAVPCRHAVQAGSSDIGVAHQVVWISRKIGLVEERVDLDRPGALGLGRFAPAGHARVAPGVLSNCA